MSNGREEQLASSSVSMKDAKVQYACKKSFIFKLMQAVLGVHACCTFGAKACCDAAFMHT